MEHKLALGLTAAGAVLVVFIGVMGWYGLPAIIDGQIAKQTRLEKDGETFEKWADVPYPIYLTFRVFNVTNADDVNDNGAKPILEEKGPYYYRQSRQKVEVTQNNVYDPEYTMQYREKKTYWFDAEMSGENTEDDLVNIVNIPFVAVINTVQNTPALSGFIKLIANVVLVNETLVRTDVRVGDLLFEGFNVSKYTESDLLGSRLPEEFSGGRFGLYKGENGTLSEEYDIFTGVRSHEEFGLINKYNGKSDLGFWKPRTECDKVKGTDGSIYPPFLTEDRKIDVFSSDLCRSLTFTFAEKVDYMDIEAYRFTVPKWTLEDPRINSENECYCLAEDLQDCPKAGAMSLAGCRNGAPIMMSTPYFLDGDQGYFTDSGLQTDADPEEHVTFLDIEPHSGVLLRGHKRIQVNIEVKKIAGVDALENLQKDMVFPVVWADESAEMDEENADEIKSKLLKPLKIVNITKWVVLGVGVVVMAAGLGLFVYQRRRKQMETA